MFADRFGPQRALNYQYSYRQDRCHRIGQMRAVTVYRLVTMETVEEDIYEIGKCYIKILVRLEN